MDVEPKRLAGDSDDTAPKGDGGGAHHPDAVVAKDKVVADLLDAVTGHAKEVGAAPEPDPGANPAARKESERDDALRAAISVKPIKDQPPLDADHPLFQAIMRQTVLTDVSAHADENPNIEVCGVLIGTVYENPQASFVYIDGMIRGEASTGRSTAVTFTAQTWQHIHKVMEEKHPGKKIIAWYHTHPGFGIFLSEMDLFIQRHFFKAPWQMAFVVDPQSRESGMFAWRQAQVRRIEYVVDDETTDKKPEAAFPSLPYLSSPSDFQEDPKPAQAPAAVEELAGRIAELESRVRMLSVGFAILLAVAIIWPFVVPLVMPAKEAPSSPAQPATMPTGSGNPQPTLPLRSN